MKSFSFTFLSILCLVFSMQAFAGIIKSTKSGTWTDATVWSTGVVPGATDDVYIQHAISYDADSAAVNNLFVGSDTSTTGGWSTSKTKQTILTVYGNILIYPNTFFKALTSGTSPAANLMHLLYLQGNLTNNGSGFDLKVGSNGTLGVVNVIFFGTTNSTVTMAGAYSSTNNEFNGVTVNKTGTSRVILGSDMVICSGSSSYALNFNPVLYLTNGIVETGTHMLVHQSTTSAHIDTGHTNSYILGNLARGMSSSAGKTCTFPIGDKNGYRPVVIKSSTSGVATGHYIKVACVAGDANTGSSTFTDGLIDKVSSVRYYRVTYSKLDVAASAPDTMGVDTFRPSYATGDGIASGNSDLRIAYSVDERASWLTLHDNYPDLTAVSDVPKYLLSDTLANRILLTKDVNSLCFAIARLTGTTTNTLVAGPSDVRLDAPKVKGFNLEQNYPNPFNPTTTINYNVPENSFVSLKVYNSLGKEVATLTNEYKSSGYYQAKFGGSDLASGLYFYTLKAGTYSITKKMILVK